MDIQHKHIKPCSFSTKRNNWQYSVQEYNGCSPQLYQNSVSESRCDNPAGQTDRGGVGSVSRRMWHLCDQRNTGTGSWDNVPEEEAGTGAAAPQGGPAHNEPPIIGLEFSGPREIKQCVNCVNNIYWSYDG